VMVPFSMEVTWVAANRILVDKHCIDAHGIGVTVMGQEVRHCEHSIWLGHRSLMGCWRGAHRDGSGPLLVVRLLGEAGRRQELDGAPARVPGHLQSQQTLVGMPRECPDMMHHHTA
jgi:hypothetical protein